jgi:predicted AlkP superfamily pyrophosphatase or phosphodiesterase
MFRSLKGSLGWDNTLASMQAIFMARGPSFNKNIQINSLNNVDIYHIACRILNLTPNPYATAGSLANLTSLFPTIETNSTTTRPIMPVSNSGSLRSANWFLSVLSIIFKFSVIF